MKMRSSRPLRFDVYQSSLRSGQPSVYFLVVRVSGPPPSSYLHTSDRSLNPTVLLSNVTPHHLNLRKTRDLKVMLKHPRLVHSFLKQPHRPS